MNGWRLLVIFCALPVMSWAGCSGTWTGNVDDTWSDPGNWGACPGSCANPCDGTTTFPGATATGDTATFNGTDSTNTITLDTDAVGLAGLLFDVDAYTITDPTSTFELEMTAGGTINVLSNLQILDVPVSFTGFGDITLNLSGALTRIDFRQAVTDSGLINVIAKGTDPGVLNVGNVDNTAGFSLTGDLILNPGPGDHLLFINENAQPVAGGFGSTLLVDRLVVGGSSNGGYLNFNSGSITAGEGASAGANEIVLDSTNGVAKLICINEGNIVGAGGDIAASHINTPLITGPGEITIINLGDITGLIFSTAAGAEITVLNAFDLEAKLDLTNEGQSLSLAVGATFQAADDISFQITTLTNNGNTLGGFSGVGTALDGEGSLTFKNTTTMVNNVDIAGGIGCSIGAAEFISFESNTEIINNGSLSFVDRACRLDAGTDLTFSMSNSNASILNRGTIDGIGVLMSAGANFVKSGSGALTMENLGSITANGRGVQAFFGTDLVMSGGDINLFNRGDVNGGFGVLASGATFPFGTVAMSGGNALVANFSNISNAGTGNLVFAQIYDQTGGVFTIAKSPEGSVEAGSAGSTMVIQESLFIRGGILENNEYIFLNQNVEVTGTGTVQGTGTFAKLNSGPPNYSDIGSFILFNNAGRVKPGNSPGVMHLIGDYDQASVGTLEIEVLSGIGPGPNGYSQLDITGSALLNGNLEIVLDSRFSLCPSDRLTILIATEGRTSEFANVIERNFPFGVSSIVEYLPTSVVLSFIFPRLSEYLGNFTQTLFSSITDTNNFFIKRRLQRVQECMQDCQTNLYADFVGALGRSNSRCQQVGFDYRSLGALLGADKAFACGGLGVLILYENIESTKVDCNWGEFHTNRAHASLYGTFVPAICQKLALDFSVGGGFDWYKIRRNTCGCSQGSPDGYELDAMISLEYTCTKSCFQLIPMANLQYAHLHIDGYEELQGFTYQSQKADSLSTILGLWADYTFCCKCPLTFGVNLGWQAEFLNHGRTLEFCNRALRCNQSLCLEGAPRNNLLFGVDLLLQVTKCIDVEFSYDLIWNNRFNRNAFYAGLNASF